MKLPFFEWILNFGKQPIKNSDMKIVDKTGRKGIDLIKKFEGFRSKPYLDAVGIPTIGYGATHYGNGVKVKMTDKPITEEQGVELLKRMLKEYDNYVNRLLKVQVNQNQFDALVSFTYNLGGGALSQSTLLKRVNVNPNDPDIRNQFMRWTKAGGRELSGLVRRRKEEANLYFS